MLDDDQGNERTPLVKKVLIDEELSGLQTNRLPSFGDDVIDTLRLGVPIFISMLSWVGVSADGFFASFLWSFLATSGLSSFDITNHLLIENC